MLRLETNSANYLPIKCNQSSWEQKKVWRERFFEFYIHFQYNIDRRIQLSKFTVVAQFSLFFLPHLIVISSFSFYLKAAIIVNEEGKHKIRWIFICPHCIEWKRSDDIIYSSILPFVDKISLWKKIFLPFFMISFNSC